MSVEDNQKRIQDSLRLGHYAQNPHEAAEDRAILAGEFSWICGQLEEILKRKPAIWNTMRKDVKSDTACERAWQQTSDGLDEEGLRLRLKSCEKMMQGLGTLIRMATEEAKNNL